MHQVAWWFCPDRCWRRHPQMSSLEEWFEAYGRPANDPALRPRNMYTHYLPINRRCCGEASVQQKMVKGILTR